MMTETCEEEMFNNVQNKLQQHLPSLEGEKMLSNVKKKLLMPFSVELMS